MKAATFPVSLSVQSAIISIHAAREGGDVARHGRKRRTEEISIHAAREGGDPFCVRGSRYPRGFQSTPPVKAATMLSTAWLRRRLISIHAAREGGDSYSNHTADNSDISIHAAREGGDVIKVFIDTFSGNFNPRRP